MLTSLLHSPSSTSFSTVPYLVLVTILAKYTNLQRAVFTTAVSKWLDTSWAPRGFLSFYTFVKLLFCNLCSPSRCTAFLFSSSINQSSPTQPVFQSTATVQFTIQEICLRQDLLLGMCSRYSQCLWKFSFLQCFNLWMAKSTSLLLWLYIT